MSRRSTGRNAGTRRAASFIRACFVLLLSVLVCVSCGGKGGVPDPPATVTERLPGFTGLTMVSGRTRSPTDDRGLYQVEIDQPSVCTTKTLLDTWSSTTCTTPTVKMVVPELCGIPLPSLQGHSTPTGYISAFTIVDLSADPQSQRNALKALMMADTGKAPLLGITVADVLRTAHCRSVNWATGSLATEPGIIDMQNILRSNGLPAVLPTDEAADALLTAKWQCRNATLFVSQHWSVTTAEYPSGVGGSAALAVDPTGYSRGAMDYSALSAGPYSQTVLFSGTLSRSGNIAQLSYTVTQPPLTGMTISPNVLFGGAPVVAWQAADGQLSGSTNSVYVDAGSRQNGVTGPNSVTVFRWVQTTIPGLSFTYEPTQWAIQVDKDQDGGFQIGFLQIPGGGFPYKVHGTPVNGTLNIPATGAGQPDVTLTVAPSGTVLSLTVTYNGTVILQADAVSGCPL